MRTRLLWKRTDLLTDNIRECPNCGAYVLSEDRHCPRCDFPLDEPPPEPEAAEPAPESDASPPEPPAEEPGSDSPVEIVGEIDQPTTRLPWAKPVFAAEPAAPEDPGEREPAPPEEEEPADEPEAPGATRAHTVPSEPEAPAEARYPAPSEDGELADALEAPGATRAHTVPSEPEAPAEAVELAPHDDLTGLAVPDLPDVTRANMPPPPPDVPDEPEDRAGDEAPEEAAPEPAGSSQDSGPGAEPETEPEPEAPPQDADTNALEPEPAGPAVDFAAEKTMPRLTEDLVHPADEMGDAGLDDSEMPTAQFRQRLDEPGIPDESTLVRESQEAAATPRVPPAPYTPPPGPVPQPMPAYMPDPGVAYLQQRVQAYVYGGYRLHVHAPHEATLSQGKQLGVGGWMLALVSVIGFLWYLLIVLVSGFKPDMAYLVLEADGRVYEDGPGAAHIRHQRARAGRRWSIFGLVVLFLSLGLAVVLVAVAGIVLTQERYQAALREAYPAVTLFEERFSDAQADPDDVELAETGAVVYAVLAGLALLGLWGGATLFVIGTVHAGAYRVKVPPLPGYA